jgi:hypothetical protein
MTPQRRRYHGNRVEQPPIHAQKANLKGQTQLQCRSPPIFDDLPLCQRERKEGLDLEGRQFPRQLFQTQKGNRGTDTAITEKSYRMLLHQK